MWLFTERQILSSHQKTGNVVQRVKGRHSSFIKYHSVYCQLYVINFHGIHAFSLSYSNVSVILYCYNLGHFVEDFYELSIILISYELELSPGIKSNPADQRKC